MRKNKFNKIADKFASTVYQTKEYIRIPLFLKLTGDIKNKSVADFGCGDGFFTRILVQNFPKKTIGIDCSEKFIKKAIKKEKSLKQNITFLLKDVRYLDLKEKFDLISSVYLLDHAETKKDLSLMIKSIYKHLEKDGKFCAIVPHPNIKPMKEFEYERRVTSVSGRENFSDGDVLKCEIRKDNKHLEFIFYYWSKETYEDMLKKAGFKNIQWIKPFVSDEGIKRFGSDYWKNFLKKPSPQPKSATDLFLMSPVNLRNKGILMYSLV